MKQTYKFISLYDLDPVTFKGVKHIDRVNDFESESSSLFTNSAYGHLLFMKGHLSPEWLLATGA